MHLDRGVVHGEDHVPQGELAAPLRREARHDALDKRRVVLRRSGIV